MTHLIYGSRWNNQMSMMLGAVPEEEARRRYEEGLEVTIACGPDELTADVPDDLDFEGGEQAAEWSLYTELSRSARMADQDDVAVVQFYNFWGTRETDYYFYRQGDGRLFLTDVTEYEFADTTRLADDYDWTVMTEHLFRPDGTSRTTERRTTPDGGTEERTTEFRGGDVTTHWEPVPAWGEWASITRRDRSRPA